jgi:hypothetical protein
MRPIKFRAWDKERRIMYEWNPYFFADTSPVTGYGDDFPGDDGDIVLMQFTGLYDFNGDEIYEGDILRDPEHKHLLVVEWAESLSWDGGGSSHPGFYFRGACWTGDLDYGTGFHDKQEVIGNIYEHPELLK